MSIQQDIIDQQKYMETNRTIAHYIRKGRFEKLKDYIEQGNEINIHYIDYTIQYNKPEFFIYMLNKLDNDALFTTALHSALANISFLKSLILIHNFDLNMKDGYIFTVATIYHSLYPKRENPLNVLLLGAKDDLLNLNTETDIEKLSDKYVTGAKDAFIYPIGYIYDPLIMIKYGFFPTSIEISVPFFIDYINGMSLNEIDFWYDKEDVDVLLSLNIEPRWSYKTLETHKRNGIISAISLPLMLSAPELLYKQSKRPITDMALFRSPISNKIRRDQIVNNTVIIDNEVWNTVPVTRYAEGMSRGLYFGDTTQDYCGTFYYYEPESTTLLAYKTGRSFFNKYIADRTLKNILDKEILERVDKTFMKYIKGELPKDLILTPDEYVLYKIELYGKYDGPDPSTIPSSHYIGMKIYSLEDFLDQPLCTLGKDNNLDIIILEYMPGNFQVVTEIVDTRSRKDSFKSLIYIID